MYKLNLVLIVLSCLAIFGGATWLAVGSGAPEAPPPTVDDLIRDLGDSDPDVRKEAQKRLMESGDEAVSALNRASSSRKRILASRARRLLARMGETAPVVRENLVLPEPGPVSPTMPHSNPTVHLDVSVLMDRHVYVRLVNDQSVPLMVARERESDLIVCGTFGWFELENGQKIVSPPGNREVEWVAVDPGESVEVFMGDALAVPDGEPARMRFVYDSTAGGEYRKSVRPTEAGAPLPPERFVSAWIEVPSPGN